MTAREIERAAYIAAHQILVANTCMPELACPGARRSHAVDTIADIIRHVFELQDDDLIRTSRRLTDKVGRTPQVIVRRGAGALLELPLRASS